MCCGERYFLCDYAASQPPSGAWFTRKQRDYIKHWGARSFLGRESGGLIMSWWAVIFSLRFCCVTNHPLWLTRNEDRLYMLRSIWSAISDCIDSVLRALFSDAIMLASQPPCGAWFTRNQRDYINHLGERIFLAIMLRHKPPSRYVITRKQLCCVTNHPPLSFRHSYQSRPLSLVCNLTLFHTVCWYATTESLRNWA